MTEIIWDEWQKEFINHKGSVTGRCGRQSGKSTAAGKRRAIQMLEYKKSISLVIAPAQRQSSGLFDKTLAWLMVENDKYLVKAGGFKPNPAVSSKRNLEMRRQFEYDHGIFNELPTKTTIVLKDDFLKPQGHNNRGSVYYSYPAGKTGVYLRFLALDFLDIDEAAFVPDIVYNTLKPMLSISAKTRGLGWETLLSTPFGKGGFFYDSFHSNDYKQFHVSAEDCSRHGVDFLAKEKKRLSTVEYAQEYLAEFIDSLNQFFPTKLIKKCMSLISWSKEEDYAAHKRYFAGMDFAGYGFDDNTLVVSELHKNRVRIVKCFEFEKIEKDDEYDTLTSDTIKRTKLIDHEFKFRKIFTDDGGLGSPITDMLKETLGRRKICELGNARKRIEVQGEEKNQGILKEDLYSNSLMLMECDMIEIIHDMKLLRSLKSVMKEYRIDASGKKHIKIHGKDTHLAEAFVRACWCVKEKGLNLYMH